jgi:hypothetical protein
MLPLGKTLEPFSTAYITIDFSKYQSTSLNISESKHFVLFRQAYDSTLPEYITDHFGTYPSTYQFKIFNFDFKNASIII